MIIDGVNSAAFLRTLLAISSAYMDRVADWQRDFMPYHYKGISSATEAELGSAFDFIVVGSGYAGSLVASRLAATGCYRVLLVEAGSAPTFESFIPFLQPGNITKHTWGFKTIPQRYAAKGLQNHEVKLKSGKSLGGSSMVDTGVYMPENPKDFRRWARQFGLVEWDRKEITPYFFKVQERSSNNTQAPPEFPEEEGNDTSSRTVIHQNNPLSFLWVQAGMAMGYPVMHGIESEIYEKGAFFVPNMMSRKGIRVTPATQFLKNINRNLVILTEAEVTKVDFDDGVFAAVGVELRDVFSDKTYKVAASREVILSAGGIGSSKILLQSGIGPVDHLDELQIPTVQHLPVGVQIRDRVRADVFIDIRSLFSESLRKKLMDMDELKSYFINGTGILARSNMFGAAVLKTEEGYEPDLMIEMKPFGLFDTHDKMENELNYKEETMHSIDPSGELETEGGLQITLTVLNPFSVGTMWLRRVDNTTDYRPVVNPSYLQDDRDLVTLVKGAQFVEAMMDTDYMRLLNARLKFPTFSGCHQRENTTSQIYWRCILRHLATTGNHLTSGNAMLHVTDPDLTVRGVRRLRVVDESVFPEPVTGGLPASIMALANRGAELIINANAAGCFKKKHRA